MTGCESSVSGYTGVYDLSGNVYEWEDSCSADDGETDLCVIRGGSLDSGSYNLACDHDNVARLRDGAGSYVGFRCCSDP